MKKKLLFITLSSVFFYNNSAYALPNDTIITTKHTMGKKNDGIFISYENEIVYFNNFIKSTNFLNEFKENKVNSGHELSIIYNNRTKNFYLYNPIKNTNCTIYPNTELNDFTVTHMFSLDILGEDTNNLKNFRKYLEISGYKLSLNNSKTEIWKYEKIVQNSFDNDLTGTYDTREVIIDKTLDFPIKFISKYFNQNTNKEMFINTFEVKSVKLNAGLTEKDFQIPKGYIKTSMNKPFKDLSPRNRDK